MRRPRLLGALVHVGREHLDAASLVAAAIVSGLPLNVPIWSYTPSLIADMTSSVPPMAPHGRPPPSALARQTMSGVTPNSLVAPPQSTTRPRLHLVEREQHAVLPGELAHTLAGSRAAAG